jgi:hypothetical protein
MFTKNRILLGLLIVFIVVFTVLIYYVQNQPISKEGFTDEENAEISQAKFYTSSLNKLPTSLLDMVKQSDFNNSSMKDISSKLDSSVNYLRDIPPVAFELTSAKSQIPSYSSSLDKTMKILYNNKLPDNANIYIPMNTHVQSHRDNATVSGINRISVPKYEVNSPEYNDNILHDYELGKSKNFVTATNNTKNNVINTTSIVSGNVIIPLPTNINVDGNNYAQYLSYNYGNVYSVNRQTGDMYSPVNNNYTITGNVSTTGNIAGNAFNSLQAYNDYTDYDFETVITPYMGCINSGKTEEQCSVFATSY